ncbi:uncharacterized protein isoform X2 [Musca autumnalis]|uniref:uncharacterized protein isoform X2 n=1 Tax=Musca autumnalis TaxID=221902 RepID=UPI003CF89DE4
MDHRDFSSEGVEGSKPNTEVITNQQIFVVDLNGEVQIQLEGSHTTASTTESDSSSSQILKNVKFDDEVNRTRNNVSLEGSSLTLSETEGNEENECFPPPKADKTHKIATENEDIAQRFKQIMDMFDSFTKNLESLDTSPITVRPSDELRTRTMPNTNESCDIQKSLIPFRQTELRELCSGLTANNVDSASLAAETSFHENTSFGQSSMVTISMCTSKSELPLSLNNYANAENALSRIPAEESHSLQDHTIEMPKDTQETATFEEEVLNQTTFHTIHIDTTSSPSSSAMLRPPLCRRLWDAITDFCAAICLCLQLSFIVLLA